MTIHRHNLYEKTEAGGNKVLGEVSYCADVLQGNCGICLISNLNFAIRGWNPIHGGDGSYKELKLKVFNAFDKYLRDRKKTEEGIDNLGRAVIMMTDNLCKAPSTKISHFCTAMKWKSLGPYNNHRSGNKIKIWVLPEEQKK